MNHTVQVPSVAFRVGNDITVASLASEASARLDVETAFIATR
jgi:hypothetical protein